VAGSQVNVAVNLDPGPSRKPKATGETTTAASAVAWNCARRNAPSATRTMAAHFAEDFDPMAATKALDDLLDAPEQVTDRSSAHEHRTDPPGQWSEQRPPPTVHAPPAAAQRPR
jgi:hypothetical protein